MKWAGVLPAQGPCRSLGFRVAAQGRSQIKYSTGRARFQGPAKKNMKIPEKYLDNIRTFVMMKK
jgi:hypothetical protein